MCKPLISVATASFSLECGTVCSMQVRSLPQQSPHFVLCDLGRTLRFVEEPNFERTLKNSPTASSTTVTRLPCEAWERI
eukprot:4532613-Amphidinium_carterae.2